MWKSRQRLPGCMDGTASRSELREKGFGSGRHRPGDRKSHPELRRLHQHWRTVGYRRAFGRDAYELILPPGNAGLIDYDHHEYAGLPQEEKNKIAAFIKFIVSQNQ